MADTLTRALAERGFIVEEESVNARGRVLLVISGPGLEHFRLYQTEAQELADGRLTVEELLLNRATVANAKQR